METTKDHDDLLTLQAEVRHVKDSVQGLAPKLDAIQSSFMTQVNQMRVDVDRRNTEDRKEWTLAIERNTDKVLAATKNDLQQVLLQWRDLQNEREKLTLEREHARAILDKENADARVQAQEMSTGLKVTLGILGVIATLSAVVLGLMKILGK